MARHLDMGKSVRKTIKSDLRHPIGYRLGKRSGYAGFCFDNHTGTPNSSTVCGDFYQHVVKKVLTRQKDFINNFRTLAPHKVKQTFTNQPQFNGFKHLPVSF
ncbi:hypothetical protein ATL17_0406 [Maritalea mobilis]|uniref:Uncharacterized protein n=2 Tax=Maritalea mobilis TaxID=483324 RepID=A0A4R6VUY4_9HYPH|nr:hypothetical protein ATL17_0406 [Maritalea mobilis]